jgi:cell division septal protein FtsQ
VTVGRKFPNAVGASLSVRQPVVAIQTAFGSYEVDADNTPIRRLRPEMAGRLIPVSLTTTSPVVPGARLYNLGITAAIHIASSPQNRMNVPISKIEVDQSGDIWLNMGNGIRIILGQSDQVDTKITALGRLFNKDPSLGTRVSEINLSCPDWPACRLRVPTPVLTKGNAIASSSERQKHGNHER